MYFTRKQLNTYDNLISLNYMDLDYSLESIFKALQDVDDNNFNFAKVLHEQNKIILEQNQAFQKQINKLEEHIKNTEMKINYLLDHHK